MARLVGFRIRASIPPSTEASAAPPAMARIVDTRAMIP
jgi:hypothetical protein